MIMIIIMYVCICIIYVYIHIYIYVFTLKTIRCPIACRARTGVDRYVGVGARALLEPESHQLEGT